LKLVENSLKVMNPSACPSQDRAYAFGPFTVDASKRALFRDGVAVPLLPKSFDALLVLVRNSGRLLDKEFLLAEIWPDAHVEENNLARAISDIRKALGEGPKDQLYVVTVARRGYRFAAQVAVVDDRGPAAVATSDGPTPLPMTEVSTTPLTDAMAGVADDAATIDEPRDRRWWVYGAVAVALALVVVGAWRFTRLPSGTVLDERDVLVLADFTNQTGESVFDGTLREALAVQLERSPFLKVMDDVKLKASVRRMGRG
jgi:DNA-binding winged helix-turn-helix (wHTH) protein